MSGRLRVVFVTPEIPPFSRSGPLAEFSVEVPRRLLKLGVDISLILPRHRTPESGALHTDPDPAALSVPMDGDQVKAGVFGARLGDVPALLVDQPKYFLRDSIYGPPGAGYLDNDERFVFFSRAATELLRGLDPPADVVHCHDWATALVPVFLGTHYRDVPALGRAASVLTVHNSLDQGEFPPESLAWTGLNWDFFNHGRLSLNGKFNFLKAGLAFADAVTAGGAAAVREAGRDKAGRGLEDAVRERGAAFAVIAPGAGPEGWDKTAGDYLEVYRQALKIKRGE